MRIKLISKQKKGFSLLEVLIMLTIISFTIIAAMSIVARVNVSIKNNEILDAVNDNLIRSLELVKSPSKINMASAGVAQLNANTSFHYFSLKEQTTIKYLDYIPTATDITDCDTASVYYVPIIINGVTKNYLVCIQYKIRRQNGVGGKRYYEVVVNAVYYVEGRKTTDTLRTYRYVAFNSI